MIMTKLNAKQPIGLFDSGIGGLTVAHALLKILPNEDVIYFGDTAHLPYGDKSEQAILNYASKITEFLLERNVKLIVIACSSASSVAYDYIRQTVNQHALTINVIDPIVTALTATPSEQVMGLIGTRRTVHSQSYQNKFKAQGITLRAHATPLLASAIEEGFAGTRVMQELIKHYLHSPTLKNIDQLILGCTHYPIIKNEISQYYEANALNHIRVIDPSDVVAEHIAKTLQQQSLLNTQGKGIQYCYLSDVTDSFARGAQVFFSQPIEVLKYPLWD